MALGLSFNERGEVIDSATGRPYRARPEFKTVRWSEFLQIDFPEPEYIVEPWLPMRGICMLFAKAGAGKTWSALDIALSVASGRPALDYWKVPKSREVLYIDGEMDGAEFRDRSVQIAMAKGINEEIKLSIMGLSIQAQGMPMVDDILHQEAIDAACYPADLIIVDNLSSLTRMPENEGESWIPVQEWALRMRAQGKAVLFIHHAGKGGDQRGTSRREDVMNTVVRLIPVEDASPEETLFDWHFKKHRGFNGKETDSLRIELVDHADTGLVSWNVQRLNDLEEDDLVDYIRQGWNYTDIAQELGITKGAVSKRAKRAVMEGRLSGEELPKQGRRRNEY